jgi:DNA gyrase subunit B
MRDLMENIKVLDFIPAMRRRPDMYIGKDHERSVNTLVQGVIEELFEIDGRHFKITLGADGFATVIGDDSGILAEDRIIDGKAISRIEYALTHALCGTGYGACISITNGFSEQLEIKIWHGGSVWEQSYERGVPQCALSKTGVSEAHGSCIRFLPDKEFFVTAEFDYDSLIRYLRGQVEWYEGKISGEQPNGFYEQSAFKKAAQYKEARFSIIDERRNDAQTGKPRHLEF